MSKKKLTKYEIISIVVAGISLIISIIIGVYNINSINSQNKLINDQLSPNIYFKVDSTKFLDESFDQTSIEGIINITSFRDNPNIRVIIINKGSKPVLIYSIIGYTLCNNDEAKLKLAYFNITNSVIESGEHLAIDESLRGALNNWNVSSCDINFRLLTDVGSFEDSLLLG
ncbi:MAG: hypothetical protein ACP5NV_02445 [Candidatus Woesearchaeota archaeon]